MPLVAHSSLPAFAALAGEGIPVVAANDRDPALPDIRLGLLNLMPDAALQATERQFMRLVSAYGEDANLYVIPFAVRADYRADVAVEHIRAHYSSFDALRADAPDALIVTGANPAAEDITTEAFWTPMIEVIDWGRRNTKSVLCSCLATHAVLHHYHDMPRIELPQRQWGVYPHEILVPDHPLLRGVTAPVTAPHSHRYAVSRQQMEAAGLTVLVASDEAGVHLAVGEGNAKSVFFQGHPEYDAISLLKEYKREVQRYRTGSRQDYPPFPEHYLDAFAKRRLEEFQQHVAESDFAQMAIPPFPETELAAHVRNTWQEAGMRIYRNWLSGIVAAQ